MVEVIDIRGEFRLVNTSFRLQPTPVSCCTVLYVTETLQWVLPYSSISPTYFGGGRLPPWNPWPTPAGARRLVPTRSIFSEKKSLKTKCIKGKPKDLPSSPCNHHLDTIGPCFSKWVSIRSLGEENIAFFLVQIKLIFPCAQKYDVFMIWRVDVAAPVKFFVSSMLVCTINTSIFSIFFK